MLKIVLVFKAQATKTHHVAMFLEFDWQGQNPNVDNIQSVGTWQLFTLVTIKIHKRRKMNTLKTGESN